MKIIKYLNTFAVGLPVALLLTYPIIKEDAIFMSLVSTILTGFIQVLIGIHLFINKYKKELVNIYLISVAAFFSLWYILSIVGCSETVVYIMMGIPIVLAVYLSIIVHTKPKN